MSSVNLPEFVGPKVPFAWNFLLNEIKSPGLHVLCPFIQWGEDGHLFVRDLTPAARRPNWNDKTLR